MTAPGMEEELSNALAVLERIDVLVTLTLPMEVGVPESRPSTGLFQLTLRQVERLAQGYRSLKILVESRAREIKKLTDRAEQGDVQLAGCSAAALGATHDPAVPGQYGWSVAYQDVLELRKAFELLAGGHSPAQVLAMEQSPPPSTESLPITLKIANVEEE